MQTAFPYDRHRNGFSGNRRQPAFPQFVTVPSGFASAEGEFLFQIPFQGDADRKVSGGIQNRIGIAGGADGCQKDWLVPEIYDAAPSNHHTVGFLSLCRKEDTAVGQGMIDVLQILFVGNILPADLISCFPVWLGMIRHTIPPLHFNSF